jgi:two-component system NtrC family response regulator
MAANPDSCKPLVLIVDDQYNTLRPLVHLIAQEEFSAVWAPDAVEGLKLLKEQAERTSIVIVDLRSCDVGGGGFVLQARRVAPQAPILITGSLTHFLYRNGVFYEFSGPPLKQEINAVLRTITQSIRLPGNMGRSSRRRTETAGRRERMGPIIGKSREMNELYDVIMSLRDSSATVLIQGESGTGKELIARAIHEAGARRKRPFIAINCGAIPEALMESELFGHERGAFTGAFCQKKGKFEIAHGGAVFLDEIGELSKDLQVKLLRVLQEKEFQRVGGNVTCKTDVRVIAATCKNLRESMAAGEFREDLFYRLNVIPLHVPPLRERKEDIPLLLEYFFEKVGKDLNHPAPLVSKSAWKALAGYSYPGNIRELANIVERLLTTCSREKILLEDLPAEVRGLVHDSPVSRETLKDLPEEGVSLKDMERELIIKTLEKTSGNKNAAARMLRITRRLLYLRLAEYGIS